MKNKGFTLVETLIATLIFSIILIGTSNLIVYQNKYSQASRTSADVNSLLFLIRLALADGDGCSVNFALPSNPYVINSTNPIPIRDGEGIYAKTRSSTSSPWVRQTNPIFVVNYSSPISPGVVGKYGNLKIQAFEIDHIYWPLPLNALPTPPWVDVFADLVMRVNIDSSSSQGSPFIERRIPIRFIVNQGGVVLQCFT